MVSTILGASRLASDVLQLRSTIRIGITGLARAGKTALLSSLAANLLALSAGRHSRSHPTSPHLLPTHHNGRLGRRLYHCWPLTSMCRGKDCLPPLAPQGLRLEFLDYPGEWLLDLPLLGQSFADWSEVALRLTWRL